MHCSRVALSFNSLECFEMSRFISSWACLERFYLVSFCLENQDKIRPRRDKMASRRDKTRRDVSLSRVSRQPYYATAIYVKVSIKTRFYLFDNLYGTRDTKGKGCPKMQHFQKHLVSGKQRALWEFC